MCSVFSLTGKLNFDFQAFLEKAGGDPTSWDTETFALLKFGHSRVGKKKKNKTAPCYNFI